MMVIMLLLAQWESHLADNYNTGFIAGTGALDTPNILWSYGAGGARRNSFTTNSLVLP